MNNVMLHYAMKYLASNTSEINLNFVDVLGAIGKYFIFTNIFNDM